MTDKDFLVGTVGIPTVGHINRKPCYLVTLTSGKSTVSFLSLDKPLSENGLLQVKGFYTDLAAEQLVKTFIEVVSSTPKENILDMMFPLHRVFDIRSLVFNANKTSSLK